MALASEQRSQGGTVVRVRLLRDPIDVNGLLGVPVRGGSFEDLAELCKYLAPTSSVDIWVRELGASSSQQIISGDDWTALESGELYDRLYGSHRRARLGMVDDSHVRDAFVEDCETIENDSGHAVARLSINAVRTAWLSEFDNKFDYEAVVTVGGLRACSMSESVGVFSGESVRASRDEAEPIASPEAIRVWASEHLENALNDTPDALARWELSKFFSMCGVKSPDLILGITSTGLLNESGIVEWAKDKRAVRVCSQRFMSKSDGDVVKLYERRFPEFQEVTLDDDVILIDWNQVTKRTGVRHWTTLFQWPFDLTSSRTPLLEDEADYRRRRLEFYGRRIPGLVIAAISTGMGIDNSTLEEHVAFPSPVIESQEVGSLGTGERASTYPLCSIGLSE